MDSTSPNNCSDQINTNPNPGSDNPNKTKARKRDRINKSKSHEGTFRHSGISEGSNRSVDTRVKVDSQGDVTTEPIFVHLPQEDPPTQNGHLKVVEFEYTDYDPDAQSKCTKIIEKLQRKASDLYRKHKLKLKYCAIIVFAVLYFMYFAFAINYSLDGAKVLIVLTSLIVGYLIFKKIWTTWGDKIYAKSCGPVVSIMDRPWWKYCRW